MMSVALILMTALSAIASLCLKMATFEKTIKKVIFSKYFISGGTLYLLAAFINLYLLYKLEYSLLLPLSSITYIWTLVLAKMILKEKISKRKIGGIVGIGIGVFLLTI